MKFANIVVNEMFMESGTKEQVQISKEQFL